MNNETAKKFSFVSSAVPADTFAVTHFKGTEGLSQCYEFEINLVSENMKVDMDKVLAHPATFTIMRAEGDIRFNGILLSFDQLHHYNQYAFYRAVLVPRLKWLKMIHHNQVFLNQKPHDILSTLLKDGGLTAHDFEMRLQWEEEYPVKEYACQYNESHFDFFDRWMRRMGFYYYFEQSAEREKLVITDTKIAHKEMTEGKTVYYSEPSGLASSRQGETVQHFRCSQHMLPQKLQIKAYDYLKPSFPITGEADISDQGRGTVYLYTEHKIRPEDMDHITKIRAEQYACQKRVFSGTSTVPFLRPGYLFELEDHYRDDFNRKYMTVELTHAGHQVGYLRSGIREALADLEKEPEYGNSFNAIPADVQFRPDLKESYVRIYGTMHATVDAEGSGNYAELDEHGRYKILLPFDLAGRKGGKSSAWIRMLQPYAGEQHGMHFPLHKGTEVILVFTHGDPDLPVIAGAIPNPEHQSMVTGQNQTMSVIQTGGQSKIAMEDKEGSESILMHVSKQNSYMRIGAPTATDGHDEHKAKDHDKEKDHDKHEPGAGETETEAESTCGIELFTADGIEIKAETKIEVILGQVSEITGGMLTDIVGGLRTDVTVGLATDAVLGGIHELHWPEKLSFKNFEFDNEVEKLEAKLEHLEATAATKTSLITSVQEVNSNVLKAQGSTMKAIANHTRAVQDDINVINTKLDVHNSRIGACSTKINALSTELQTVGTCVDSVGTEVKSLGSKIDSIGTEIKTAGTAIKNSSLDVTNAPVIMHN